MAIYVLGRGNDEANNFSNKSSFRRMHFLLMSSLSKILGRTVLKMRRTKLSFFSFSESQIKVQKTGWPFTLNSRHSMPTRCPIPIKNFMPCTPRTPPTPPATFTTRTRTTTTTTTTMATESAFPTTASRLRVSRSPDTTTGRNLRIPEFRIFLLRAGRFLTRRRSATRRSWRSPAWTT